MYRLSRDNLSKLNKNISVPEYLITPDSDDLSSPITSGIVHFGTGNFHRAHQAVYCDNLLNQGESSWGITGISMRSPDMRNNLAPQDFLYTQATLGESTDYRVIGAIQNILVAPENPQAVIDIIANNTTQLVTTTITEKGYCLSLGKLDLTNDLIVDDLESIKVPKTTYGFIAAALIKRCNEQGTPITILCCDNVHKGGEHLRLGVELMLEKHCPSTRQWIKDNVAFSSSMVDRVTPATNEQLINLVNEQLGLSDAAPVAAEPFTQWIIEDNFAGKKPPFNKVGAQFVRDIPPFENVKLRFLNASHSILAAMGYLAGDKFIHEAIQRPTLASFAEQALTDNVVAVTSIPDVIDINVYIQEVLGRFHNQNLPYAVLQVGTDSSQKIQQRWFPSIDDALKQELDYSYLALSVAAWVNFISKALLNNDLNDPLRDQFSNIKVAGNADIVNDYLTLAGANMFAFFTNSAFMDSVKESHKLIDELGIIEAIQSTKIIKS